MPKDLQDLTHFLQSNKDEGFMLYYYQYDYIKIDWVELVF